MRNPVWEISSADRSACVLSRYECCVLLATYNGEPWLIEQLDSVLQQRNVRVVIHARDDRSTDGTLQVLQEFQRCHPDVVMTISQAPVASGSAGANFRALIRSVDIGSAKYVALCDQDDLWLPGKLIEAIDLLSAAGGAGYSGSVEAFWPDGRVKQIAQSAAASPADALFEGAGQGCTFLLTAPFFKRIQTFCRAHADLTESLHYHDWLVYLLARTWHEEWTFDPRSWLRYRQHAMNEIGARGSISAIRGRLALIRTGWYRKQVGAAAEIYRHAGGDDAVVLKMTEVLASSGPRSAWKRASLACWLLRKGRRRSGDRAILAVAALAGWL